MPGLIGYSDKSRKYGESVLVMMRDLLKYDDRMIDDVIYSDDLIYASRTHLGILDQGMQPYLVNDQLFIWLEGEFYNRAELMEKYQVPAVNDCELLTNVYSKIGSLNFLHDVDGYFAAVVYNRFLGVIHLITDRYGLKPLYWGRVGSNLIWSSELKGFLAYPDFTVKIDAQAVRQFFDIGYLLENRTWFEGIQLIPPASILAFHIADANVVTTAYWSWSEIKPVNMSIREDDLLAELGILFDQAVLACVKSDEKIGITLSGGLDSRAIVAAIPSDIGPIHTFTFGQNGCDDITIAQKVSDIKGAIHHALILDANHWLPPRVAGVWKTDGMLNILHMHGIEFCSHYKAYTDIIVSGFAGDLVFGGSYLKRRQYLDKIINLDIAQDIMQARFNIPLPVDYGIKKIDTYFLNNRVRRFTNTGLIYMGKLLETRQPFFSNSLIEFIYSLPDELRYKSHIYNLFLLSHFPRYFKDIPYQKTGIPIGFSGATAMMLKLLNRSAGKLKREAMRIGFKTKDLRQYTNYAAWIRQDPARSFFQTILSNKKALYPEFINRTNILNHLQEHLQNKIDHDNELCLVLTFELWLQQVIEGNYRVKYS